MKKQQKFKGKLLNLFTEKVTLPNGYATTIEFIDHPGAALIVPFLTAGKIILLKQFRPVINSYIYELPAGTLEKNEKAIACARREIVEETGYSTARITRLGAIYPVPGYSTEKITIFKAEKLSRRVKSCEKDEVIHTCRVSKQKVKDLFNKGRIVDSKTICALVLCGWL